MTVAAPHVGTVTRISAVGASLAQGDPFASLQVLDSVHDVSAPIDGVVASVDAVVGELVEFGGPLGTLTPVQGVG